MRCGLTWKHDPGPCPVDDTPHTACTPASVGSALTAPARRPRTLPAVPGVPVTELPTTMVGEPVTTKDYRRRGRR